MPVLIQHRNILLTVDVEDWFQVENFKPWIPFETWDRYELRVERNVHRILDLFDSMTPSLCGKEDESESGSGVKGTFFILGWIAKKLPGLVEEIRSRGHEVASHGNNHELCGTLTPQKFNADLRNSKKLLEDIVGEPIRGYRAPSFSIDGDGLRQVMESGYLYDSSWNSFQIHGRYGAPALSCDNDRCLPLRIAEDFFELPISNLRMKRPMRRLLRSSNKNGSPVIFPWGGGGYFRLIPSRLFVKGVQAILKKDGAYLFYMHPWEVDPEQPRMKQVNLQYRFRHYMNLSHTAVKLKTLIDRFSDCRFTTCADYLNTAQETPRQKPASTPC